MKSQKSSGRPKKRKLLIIRRVAGKSMLPTLRPGKLVIASGAYRELKAEDVIILSHRGLDKVKRIQHVGKGRLYVIGDNAKHSTDSTSFGWLDDDLVLGKVIWPRV